MSPSRRLALASCPLEFLFPRTLYGCLTNLLTLSLVLCPFAHSRCPSHIESLVSLVSAHCLSHSFAISLSLLFSHTHLLIHSLTHILSRCLGHSLGHCHFHRMALTPTADGSKRRRAAASSPCAHNTMSCRLPPCRNNSTCVLLRADCSRCIWLSEALRFCHEGCRVSPGV